MDPNGSKWQVSWHARYPKVFIKQMTRRYDSIRPLMSHDPNTSQPFLAPWLPWRSHLWVPPVDLDLPNPRPLAHGRAVLQGQTAMTRVSATWRFWHGAPSCLDLVHLVPIGSLSRQSGLPAWKFFGTAPWVTIEGNLFPMDSRAYPRATGAIVLPFAPGLCRSAAHGLSKIQDHRSSQGCRCHRCTSSRGSRMLRWSDGWTNNINNHQVTNMNRPKMGTTPPKQQKKSSNLTHRSLPTHTNSEVWAPQNHWSKKSRIQHDSSVKMWVMFLSLN